MMTVNVGSLRQVSTVVVVTLICTGITSCQGTKSIRSTQNPQPVVKESSSSSGLETVRPGTSLRKQATRETNAGRFQRASQLLERALRIDSRDPATYYEFARLRCLETSPQRALQLIEKGLTLKPDVTLRKKFNQLKEDCTQINKA